MAKSIANLVSLFDNIGKICRFSGGPNDPNPIIGPNVLHKSQEVRLPTFLFGCDVSTV